MLQARNCEQTGSLVGWRKSASTRDGSRCHGWRCLLRGLARGQKMRGQAGKEVQFGLPFRCGHSSRDDSHRALDRDVFLRWDAPLWSTFKALMSEGSETLECFLKRNDVFLRWSSKGSERAAQLRGCAQLRGKARCVRTNMMRTKRRKGCDGKANA